MGFGTSIGKYHLGRMIGEGTFAKVKIAVHSETGQHVAVKVIDKKMVFENKLMDQPHSIYGLKIFQVKREISTMRLLNHPNIVKIHEVIATKSKIYIVMEYISGGQLSDKMSYLGKIDEREARKFFQQLIDAVDYCHARGVYHRDLKPENLLIDNKGNLKVSDFGLSVLRKHPSDLLKTACGSPSYVAPEVIVHTNYAGAAADIWSCGVILYEMLAGYLPFEDRSLTNLYRKISRAEYKFPEWITPSQKKLISNILVPFPLKRATIAEIVRDEWFRIDYHPSRGIENEEYLSFHSDFSNGDTGKGQDFINAFRLIATSSDLDLSGLFHEKDVKEQKTKLGSTNSMDKTMEKIEVAAKDVRLSVQRMNNSKVKLHQEKRLTRSRSSHVILSAEVIEVTPAHCVVEISKYAGEIRVYKEFCKSLSSVLKENSDSSSKLSDPIAEKATKSIGAGDGMKQGRMIEATFVNFEH